jgi:hypothetical protein
MPSKLPWSRGSSYTKILMDILSIPTAMHQNAVKKILRYLKGTIYLDLVYEKGDIPDEILIGFLDSDLAGDLSDGRSIAGMAFYVNNCLVSWNSQKQKTVPLSSCEAEYMATTMVACQALWLRLLRKVHTRRA